jgi:hypothetical protein
MYLKPAGGSASSEREGGSPTVLLAHLQDLTASIGQDDQELDDPIAALTTALRSTAASYCGFELTIVNNQWPVALTAFSDGHDVPLVRHYVFLSRWSQRRSIRRAASSSSPSLLARSPISPPT